MSDGGNVDSQSGQPAETWTFDRLDRIGGHQTTMLGNPRVVETPIGKAVEFDGVGRRARRRRPPSGGSRDVHLGSDLPARRRGSPSNAGSTCRRREPTTGCCSKSA